MLATETITYGIGAAGLAVGILIWVQLLRGESPASDGHYGYLGIIPLVATSAYVVMAFKLTTITVGGVTVPVVRYIDWLLTTMVLIGYVGYTAGAPRRVVGGLVAIDALMIIVGFVGVVTPGTGRLAAFVFSSLCYLGLLAVLYSVLPSYARDQSYERHRLFKALQNHVGLLWLAYPIVWAAGPLGLDLVSTLAVILIITFTDVTAKTPYVYFVYTHQNAFTGQEATNTESARNLSEVSTSAD